MAQKIPPAALRLHTNKHFDALWFADRVYGSLLHQTLQTKHFLHSIFRKLGTRTALSHVQATPHALFVQSFFCNPRRMNQRKKRAVTPLNHTIHFLQRFDLFLKLQVPGQNTLFSFCVKSQGNWKPFLKSASMQTLLVVHNSCVLKHYDLSPCNDGYSHALHHTMHALLKSRKSLPVHLLQNKNKKSYFPLVKKKRDLKTNVYAQHVESVLSKYLQKRVVWKHYKMKRIFTSASFIAHYMALQFEQNRKKPFRFIFKEILIQCVRTPRIVGVRISVAGCIGGADKARVETKKFGKTSLNMFSHKIDYHATVASTRKGNLGIKVWLSYRLPKDHKVK